MLHLVEIGILNAVAAAALAAVVLLVGCVVRRPALLHALWVLVLLKLVTPPLAEIPVGLRVEGLATLGRDAPAETAPPGAVALSGQPIVIPSSDAGSSEDPTGAELPPAAVAAPRNTARAAAPSDWRAAVLAAAVVWGLGAVGWFAVQAWRIARFARFVSRAEPAAERLQQRTHQLAAEMGLRQAPLVLAVDAAVSPMLWSIGPRTRILFPADLLERLDDPAAEALLCHELAHYLRRDHWVRIFELLVTGLFWWHPVVWIARRRIEVAEEHCCDAWAVEQCREQPRRYAEALLDTIDFLSEQPASAAPLASGLGEAPFLRQRLQLIMLGVCPKSMSAVGRLGVAAAAALLLPLAPGVFQGPAGRADAAAVAADGSTEVAATEMAEILAAPAVEDAAAGARPSEDSAPTAADEGPSTDAPTWAVVNSPSGRFQTIARTDGGLVLRDVFQQRRFDLGEYQITSIAFVPHRDLLAAGSADSRVYLFDCATGEAVASFSGHTAEVASVAVSFDGRMVASGGRDGQVKLWDIDYRSEVAHRMPRQNSVNCVRFSPDGRLLAVASGDWIRPDEGAVLLWDLRGSDIRQQFTTDFPVGAVAFDGQRLMAAQFSGETTSWDLASGDRRTVSSVSKDIVSAAAFAADANAVMVATARGKASATAPSWFQRMDRNQDGALTWSEFQGPRGAFRNLDADRDGKLTWEEVEANIQ